MRILSIGEFFKSKFRIKFNVLSRGIRLNSQRTSLILLLIICIYFPGHLFGKFTITYEQPTNSNHKLLYKTLKKHHQEIYGDAIGFLNDLYALTADIEIIVRDCGSIDSRYVPEEQRIYICYESIQNKVRDYRYAPKNEKVYSQRVFDNAVFTFWHEIGHAVIDDFNLPKSDGELNLEDLADEFAVISMMLRKDDKWMNAITISALHYKNKHIRSNNDGAGGYEEHSPDIDRYHNMIILLYGFRPNSFSRLKSRIDEIPGPPINCQQHFQNRYKYWAVLLQPPLTKRFYFKQVF